jgi:hypothetical protein
MQCFTMMVVLKHPKTLHCNCDCQNDNVCSYTIVGECFCQTTFFMWVLSKRSRY